MRETIDTLGRWALSRARSWRLDERGQIAILFGLSLTGMMLAVGGGVDLTRAFSARQKLSQVATLACQYASRPSVIQTIAPSYTGTNGSATYQSNVNSFITNALNGQAFPYTQTNATPFTFTVGGAADVNIAASVPTSFMKLARITQMPVGATAHCYDNSSTINQTVPNGNSNLLVKEGFENSPCTGTCVGYIDRNGANALPALPNGTFPSSPAYTGVGGNAWYVIGYCLEIDSVGLIKSSVPEGSHSAELDCGSLTPNNGNSSISTKVYLPYGNYELRYNYAGRIAYRNYDPTYICGSTAGDVSWANDNLPITGNITNAVRTNQINVYLDLNTTGSAPLHTTIDGTQQLAGSNLIDVCVYSPGWIERSVRVFVTTPGYYWLSFAADGQNDGVGGQLDNIRLCAESCTDALDDNFPPSWLAANNGGVNKVLFQDSFESPVYTQDPFTTTAHAKGGNLALSLGTTVSTGCLLNGAVTLYASPPGWPCQYAKGWAVAPYNEAWFWMQGATRGNQYPALQGWSGFSTGTDPINRAVSRQFLLDPGYYNLSYYYTSLVDFSYDFVYTNGYYNPPCRTAPTTPESLTAFGMKRGRVYGDASTLYTQYLSTNFMTVYMANGQLISTPNINAVLGGAPTYTNPNGTTTSTPTVPPDNGSIFNAYNTSASAALSSCRYYSGYTWAPQSVNIKITKPGIYWLTFSAQGDPLTASGMGAAIDDVKLTALGSLYMTPPASPVTIPVADPQPGSQQLFTGFYIIADPVLPPAPEQ